MKILSFDKLYSTEFFISEPLAKTHLWKTRGNIYSAIGKPKVSHTLLWFKNCRGTIINSDGRVIEAEKNQLAYMAKGLEYTVIFSETGDDVADTVVIHFQMTDKDGEDIAPADHPIICMKSVDSSYAMAMDMLADEFKKSIVCIPDINSAIYKILAEICKKQKKRTVKSRFACIRTGIELLEQNSDLGISEIADKCGVSECYFRRLFREYSGESPINFRQRHRIERAKQLLLSDEHFTIGEIAQELNFSDIYHFSKTFKKFCGISPNKFLQNGDL